MISRPKDRKEALATASGQMMYTIREDRLMMMKIVWVMEDLDSIVKTTEGPTMVIVTDLLATNENLLENTLIMATEGLLIETLMDHTEKGNRSKKIMMAKTEGHTIDKTIQMREDSLLGRGILM